MTPRQRPSLLRAVAILFAVAQLLAAAEPPAPLVENSLFSFPLSFEDAARRNVDLSGMNHKPAGSLGRVTVGSDGHFYVNGGRQRFLGMNLVARCGFPDHETAGKVARHLSRFGINIVRLHLLDAWDNDNRLIFEHTKDFNTRHLNEESLEKLDYFIWQLAENGIYIELGLLDGRSFCANDGLDPLIDTLSWKDRQTPALFDSTMIALQKEFAKQVLGHVNRYTGRAYGDDPAIAIVQVINENGLMQAWHTGSVDLLPPFYAGQLRGAWNRFLRDRYTTDAQWKAAWGTGTPTGSEMLRNPSFTAGTDHWTLEEHSPAAGLLTVTNEGPSGTSSARVTVITAVADPSQSWRLQLGQSGLAVEKGTSYTLRFRAKADREKLASVSIEQAHSPWENLGFFERLPLTTTWQEFRFDVSLDASDVQARLYIRDFCDDLATIWFADFSLTTTETSGIIPGESIEAGSVLCIPKATASRRAGTVLTDWSRFLWSTERQYWTTMRSYLKNDLGVKALQKGTMLGSSTPNLMSLFDVVDSHAYWQHPTFAGAAFSSTWWLGNTSMTTDRDGGRLADLGLRRVHGKPFTVSEYNHPAPNTFNAEGLPLLAAYAALQDWDAIYLYDFIDTTGYDRPANRITQWFDTYHNAPQMMSFVTAAQLFRRGDVAAARKLLAVQMSREDEIRHLPQASAFALPDARSFGMPRPAVMQHRTAIVTEESQTPAEAVPPASASLPTDGHYISDTGQLEWDAGNGLFKVETALSIGIIGFGAKKSFTLQQFTVKPGSGLQGWASIFLTSMDGAPLAKGSKRMLLLAHGLLKNRDWSWLQYPSLTPAGFPPPSGATVTRLLQFPSVSGDARFASDSPIMGWRNGVFRAS